VLKRFGPPALVTLLVVATGIAFVLTERLKLELPTIRSTKVTKQFSPTCHCDTSKARVAFSLRRSERVTLSIIGPPRGGVVRQLLGGEDRPAGPLHVIWDGRDNAGRLVPDGNYRVRVDLANGRLNTVLPNVIQLDTQAPKISSISLSSHTISPDGDHRSDVVHIGYRSNERARVILFVDGKQAVQTRYRAGGSSRFDWEGTVGGRFRLGWHSLTLRAIDSVGNESVATVPIPVRVRILNLRPKRIRVAARKSFTLAISTDRLSVRWRLDGRFGLAPNRSLVLRAPSTPGRYRVVVRSGPYRAGALVIVR
jgi:hypothetical protein